MDRTIIYPGQIPLETDLLGTNKNAMIALAKLSAVILGTSTRLNGLACIPNSPAALNVVVGPGEIYSLQNIDGTAYSSIAADTSHSILKQGILLDAVTLACPAPTTPGQSIAYLVQVTHQEIDTDAVVLPYYNASNPSQAYSGPANAGTTNNTVRKGICTVNVKAGIAATTGTQVAPAADSGFTGAYVVTVANGQTTITAPNIALASGAPFITERLADKISQTTGDARYLSQAAADAQYVKLGRRFAVFSISGTWTCPAGVTEAYFSGAGGGGGGGGATASVGGGGGGGGEARLKQVITVVPGYVYNVDIGAGGAGGGPDQIGGSGTASGISTVITVQGGSGGARGTVPTVIGTAGGPGGTDGGTGGSTAAGVVGGAGGGTIFGAGGPGGASSAIGRAGGKYGGGGGGGNTSDGGGAGAPGFVLIEW